MLVTHIFYCPYCGKEQNKNNLQCINCDKEIKPLQSKFEIEYYVRKAYDGWSSSSGKPKPDTQELIREEASHNPLFDPTSIIKPPEPDPESERQARLYFERKRQEEAKANAPKCPTCQSTNISKISTTSKVAGAAMFGLFSKTARSQFKCNNCGYKW